MDLEGCPEPGDRQSLGCRQYMVNYAAAIEPRVKSERKNLKLVKS